MIVVALVALSQKRGQVKATQEMGPIEGIVRTPRRVTQGKSTLW